MVELMKKLVLFFFSVPNDRGSDEWYVKFKTCLVCTVIAFYILLQDIPILLLLVTKC
jgi:hypothetical protein